MIDTIFQLALNSAQNTYLPFAKWARSQILYILETGEIITIQLDARELSIPKSPATILSVRLLLLVHFTHNSVVCGYFLISQIFPLVIIAKCFQLSLNLGAEFNSNKVRNITNTDEMHTTFSFSLSPLQSHLLYHPPECYTFKITKILVELWNKLINSRIIQISNA